ncbi:hypothetical protein GCM10028792_30990 [Salinisphaera aquimarina]
MPVDPPANDADFSKRWRLIKTHFSKHSAINGQCWQRRFWEHCIRDDTDFQQHLAYIHYNPVKHGLVARASEWPYSSFHRYVRQGVYSAEWGRSEPDIAHSVGRE